MTAIATSPFTETPFQPPSATSYVFTSESVSEGHPDKVCDYIADSILDAHLAQDPRSRVACEVLVKSGDVVLAGEITSNASVDFETVAREAIREIGYTDSQESFNADGVRVTQLMTRQAGEIAQGVDVGGAGDQGIMFGFATNETPELMPLPILLAHKLARHLTDARKTGHVNWLRPDSKTQVSVEYDGYEPVAVRTVLVSTMHAADVSQQEIRDYVATTLCPAVLGGWYRDDIEVLVNPTGSFVQGGPSADCGVTGRKIIVDSYGGMGRHGGGAFSGKDPSKVDRSGAYFCRFVAREIVKHGLARRAEVQVGYAIGRAEPVSVRVDTFGTGEAAAAEAFVRTFDFRPRAIIERLDLLRPIYRQSTNYGHFGRSGLSWEQ
jgi:S-adenosylmethionine synthetase